MRRILTYAIDEYMIVEGYRARSWVCVPCLQQSRIFSVPKLLFSGRESWLSVSVIVETLWCEALTKIGDSWLDE